MFGSLEWEVTQYIEITLDDLIHDLDVFNYGYGCVWFCLKWCLSENKWKEVFDDAENGCFEQFFFISNYDMELLRNYWGISNWIDSICIGWIDLWFVCFQIWICVYVILQYVIFEWKLCFDHELKIDKLAVSHVFLIF